MFRLQKQAKVNTRIPADHNGLETTLEVMKDGSVNHISVNVDIKNANPSDIQLELVGPNGKRIALQNKGEANSVGNAIPFHKSFSGTTLDSFQGSSSKGRWKLIAKNHSNKNVSVLNSWTINLDCKLGANSSNEVYTKNKSTETLISNQQCRFNGTVSALKVLVDIDHPNKKDLVVKLSSPSGKSVTLHNKEGDGRFIAKTYSVQETKGFVGETTNGTWKLSVQDFDGNTKVGKLQKWKLFMDYEPVDSLLSISGITSTAQQALNRAGINSFSKLASSAPKRIKEVLESAKVDLKDINIDKVRQQAKLAIENYTP